MHSRTSSLQAMPPGSCLSSLPLPCFSAEWRLGPKRLGLWFVSPGRGMGPGMGQVALILPGVQGVPPAWPGLAPSMDFSEVDAWEGGSASGRGVSICVAGCVANVFILRSPDEVCAGWSGTELSPHPAQCQNRSRLAQGPQKPQCLLGGPGCMSCTPGFLNGPVQPHPFCNPPHNPRPCVPGHPRAGQWLWPRRNQPRPDWFCQAVALGRDPSSPEERDVPGAAGGPGTLAAEMP